MKVLKFGKPPKEEKPIWISISFFEGSVKIESEGIKEEEIPSYLVSVAKKVIEQTPEV